ncbi:MAG: N-acetylmuramoyl-L-alanine amidase [Terriglobales bacterium]
MPSTTTKKTLVYLVLAAVALLHAASSADEKQLSVYASVATYTLPVRERSGHDYVGLLELLEPLGRVSSQSDGARWRLRFNTIDGEFVVGKTRCKIRGRDFNLAAPFLIENSRGLVPLGSLAILLPRFLGNHVNFREGARRLFIGEATLQPNFQFEAGPPPRLVLNFTAPVDPTISTEPGRLRMIFKRDPVVSPGSQSISFDNKVITQATFSENNGVAELDVIATTPLLATFSNNGRTIVLAPAPTSTANATPRKPAASGTTNPQARSSSASTGTSGGASSSVGVPRPLAVVDPAHGGQERGAALTDTLAEKDVTLGFARLLRHELELRGFAVLMLRDADTALSLDQRAGAANAAHASVYICLHAASQGGGARVFTALLPVEGPSNGIFHPWNSAQAPALALSTVVAGAIVTEMQKKQVPARESSASLRPLNNILMPAVAVELQPGPNGIADLTSANYQQQAAAAIADAVVSVRDRLGEQP